MLLLEGLLDEVAKNLIVQAYGKERHNEKLLANALNKIRNIYGERSNVFISTKCGINFATITTETRGYEGSSDQIRHSVECSLIALNISQIPLLYLYRMDPEAAEAEVIASFEALKELAEEGKIKYIGLSECTCRADH